MQCRPRLNEIRRRRPTGRQQINNRAGVLPALDWSADRSSFAGDDRKRRTWPWWTPCRVTSVNEGRGGVGYVPPSQVKMLRPRSEWSVYQFLTWSTVGLRSFAMSVSVCLFVCCPSVLLFVLQIFYPCYCVRDSVFPPRQCDKLRTSGFVDDVMFSCNAWNRPESKTTSMWRHRGQSLPSPTASCLSSIKTRRDAPIIYPFCP